MEIFDTWFDIDEYRSDTDDVIHFLRELPGKIRKLVDERNSNFYSQLRAYESKDITKEYFLEALEDARYILLSGLDGIQFRLDDDQFSAEFQFSLYQIGFTGGTLRLKAAILNAHWKRVIRMVGNATDAILDFANDAIVKVLRRFFEYLNSILGSLVEVIPGADAIKEIKEIIESFLGIADE
ncbi:MAG TPA: hypothetical protein PKV73_17525 [Agriterribacter sp.]|nr:hypothetical protein [Agriterribacter sp.]